MCHKVVVVMLSPHNAATRNLHVLTLQHYNFAKLLCWTLVFCKMLIVLIKAISNRERNNGVLYLLLQVNVKIIKIKVECKVQNTRVNVNPIM